MESLRRRVWQARRMGLAFGDLELDLATFELRRAGQRVPMEPQAFDVPVATSSGQPTCGCGSPTAQWPEVRCAPQPTCCSVPRTPATGLPPRPCAASSC